MCEVVQFRLINRNDIFDLKYKYWSRIYEYPFVKDVIEQFKINDNPNIHNTCWGFEGVHVDFKNYLDQKYENVLHSDIKKSNLKNTFVHDITKELPSNYNDHFDFVINISTIEEINFPNDIILNNLIKQTKNGGYIIITFDYRPDISGYIYNSIDLKSIENMFNTKLQTSDDDISGLNSELPEERNKLLKCGVLILKKY